jgi:hypothetical protein
VLREEQRLRIARAAAKLVYDQYENAECSCAEEDGDYPCWYHLSDKARIESLAQSLAHDPEFIAAAIDDPAAVP